MQDIYYQVTDQILLTTKGTYYRITLIPKKHHHYMFSKIKAALKESQYSIKIKNTPYPTLMQPLKKISPESIRALARNLNIDLQSIGSYSKSDIQHFVELLTKTDTIQRQSIDQNLRKLAKTAGVSDIYAQGYSGYLKI